VTAKTRPCERCFKGTETAITVQFWTCDKCDREEIDKKDLPTPNLFDTDENTRPSENDWFFNIDFGESDGEI